MALIRSCAPGAQGCIYTTDPGVGPESPTEQRRMLAFCCECGVWAALPARRAHAPSPRPEVTASASVQRVWSRRCRQTGLNAVMHRLGGLAEGDVVALRALETMPSTSTRATTPALVSIAPRLIAGYVTPVAPTRRPPGWCRMRSDHSKLDCS